MTQSGLADFRQRMPLCEVIADDLLSDGDTPMPVPSNPAQEIVLISGSQRLPIRLRNRRALDEINAQFGPSRPNAEPEIQPQPPRRGFCNAHAHLNDENRRADDERNARPGPSRANAEPEIQPQPPQPRLLNAHVLRSDIEYLRHRRYTDDQLGQQQILIHMHEQAVQDQERWERRLRGEPEEPPAYAPYRPEGEAADEGENNVEDEED